LAVMAIALREHKILTGSNPYHRKAEHNVPTIL
jgi:hypothetical protein